MHTIHALQYAYWRVAGLGCLNNERKDTAMADTTTATLDDYQRQYRDVAAKIADVGYVRSGSVIKRYNKCGTPTCGCHTDPERRHGPYWQWTAKVAGKTVTRSLAPAEAARYQEWIANDRQLRALIDEMRTIANRATELTLQQDPEVSLQQDPEV